MKKEDCIFCKIASGEIPSNTIYENSEFKVIMDIAPASKGHVLIIPKEHFKEKACLKIHSRNDISKQAFWSLIF